MNVIFHIEFERSDNVYVGVRSIFFFYFALHQILYFLSASVKSDFGNFPNKQTNKSTLEQLTDSHRNQKTLNLFYEVDFVESHVAMAFDGDGGAATAYAGILPYNLHKSMNKPDAFFPKTNEGIIQINSRGNCTPRAANEPSELLVVSAVCINKA